MSAPTEPHRNDPSGIVDRVPIFKGCWHYREQARKYRFSDQSGKLADLISCSGHCRRYARKIDAHQRPLEYYGCAHPNCVLKLDLDKADGIIPTDPIISTCALFECQRQVKDRRRNNRYQASKRMVPFERKPCVCMPPTESYLRISESGYELWDDLTHCSSPPSDGADEHSSECSVGSVSIDWDDMEDASSALGSSRRVDREDHRTLTSSVVRQGDNDTQSLGGYVSVNFGPHTTATTWFQPESLRDDELVVRTHATGGDATGGDRSVVYLTAVALTAVAGRCKPTTCWQRFRRPSIYTTSLSPPSCPQTRWQKLFDDGRLPECAIIC